MSIKALAQPRNLLLLLALLWAGWQYHDGQSTEPAPANQTSAPQFSGNQAIVQAWQQQRSGQWLTTTGRVIKTLSDDLHGSSHQRFILEIEPQLTILVAHNIDLAPRVPLQNGDQITLHGEYQWNQKGGVMHWTHADPSGRRRGGWIELRGQRYR